ncbi:D-2-hydroxyacid dehydrogenase family protein [Arthrobacter sp. Hz1]
MALRLAILDDYQGVATSFAPWHELGEDDIGITVFEEHIESSDTLVHQLEPFDVLIVMRERTAFPREVLEHLPNLRLMVTTGMANDSIDLNATRDLGIEVCGTGGSAAAAPELTWALLMTLVRNIPVEDRYLRDGGWQQGVGVELSGRTFGVLGLGRIGRTVTRYAQAFDMEVIAWSPNLTADKAEEAGARLVTKRELFSQSDVVSVHVRLSERSRHIVGEEELRLLGPHGYLINTARGPLIDEDALINALDNNWIAGAGLDVYDQEPLPAGSRWASCPRTVLTPHLGYVTNKSYRRYYSEALENIQAWLSGQPRRVLSP